MTGKTFRKSRFYFPGTEQGVIVPIDHGLTLGPLQGIRSVRQLSPWISHPSITGVIVHKGMAERLIEAELIHGKGLMIHLNGMSSLSKDPDTKELLTSVETAISLGADAVSFQVNFTETNSDHNLKLMGKVVDDAYRFGLPVLAMVYDKVETPLPQAVERLRHLIRISTELGCDMVKIAPHSHLSEILADLSEDVDIFVAGGALSLDSQLRQLTSDVANHGGAGLCVGRNVFQRPNFDEVLTQMKGDLLYALH